jgi:hypothetical protein
MHQNMSGDIAKVTRIFFFPKDKIIIIISLKNLNSKPSYSSYFSHPKKWDIRITC